MSYHAYVCKINNLIPHPNADRLQLGECFGNTVAVSLEYVPDMLGVYFPVDGQLSEEFCQYNNLLRLKNENGHSIPGGGYMDSDKRNVTAIKLRGEKSDGLFLPLSCLDFCYTDSAAAHLKQGDVIDVVNGKQICTKYIPRSSKRVGQPSIGNRTRKKRVPIAPLFAEHADTEQLAYNLGAFQPGDEIEITLKIHGTSQRTGYLPKLVSYKRTFWDKLFHREGEPIYDYGYVTGTRRVVLDEFGSGGFYGGNQFREQHAEALTGKLWKGETCYYEVAGFTDQGAPIMGNGDNTKLNDKAFVKRYGKTTTFSYGCSPTGDEELPVSQMFVYRMTMTNPDGEVVEYTPDFIRYRCEQMGVQCVPVMWRGIIPNNPACAEDDTISAGEWIKNVAERYYDGPDPIGKTHIREGVVVRITNKPKFCAYKHKNWWFKAIEGIVKVEANAPDMEEAQEDEVV